MWCGRKFCSRCARRLRKSPGSAKCFRRISKKACTASAPRDSSLILECRKITRGRRRRYRGGSAVSLRIRAKAPLRLSFAGGGTDVSPFLENEGGCVLSATITRYSWGTLTPREDSQIHLESADLGALFYFDTRS